MRRKQIYTRRRPWLTSLPGSSTRYPQATRVGLVSQWHRHLLCISPPPSPLSGWFGPSDEPLLAPELTNLQQTVVVPTLDSPLLAHKNAIWCSSYQMTWNQLKTDVIKAPIRLANAQDIADRLNRAPQSQSDFPRGSYYAAAGFVKDGIEKTIQREITRRYPAVSVPSFSPSKPDDIISFAYLETAVKFRHPYQDTESPLQFTGSSGPQRQ